MGESSKTSLLDVERLQQLSYERSTKWANFLDSCVAVEEDQEGIRIDDLDELCYDDPEDQDELASMEDEECDDRSLDSEVLRDITNSTRLALILSAHNKTTKLSESTIMQDENHELIDLLNQTVPVINEHNRQMKESGFDRILNTFDVKKIEEKVGGWLRRHNSLCTPDYMELQHVNHNENPHPVQHQTVVCQPTSVRPYRRYINVDSDSDDSLHSGETARYIRSSRAGAIKSSSSTTMMIKSYRMVKSTRQALKDKYACAQDDDAEVHLNKLRHRRRIANEVEILHSHEKHSVRAHKPKNEYITPLRTSQKRKVLRKRSASNSCSARDTSSESDTAHCRRAADKYYPRRHTCCRKRHKFTTGSYTTVATDIAASVKRSQYRATRRTPCSRRDYMYYFERAHSHSISSSSLSTSPVLNRVRNFTITCKKDSRRKIDTRPFALESECRCCNEKRVCKEYTHVTDTSTEEWIVENSYTTKKLRNVKPHSEEMISNKCSISGITTISDDVSMISNTSRKFDTTPPAVSAQPTKPKRNKTSTKKTEKTKAVLQDSFDEEELRMALKASKELYEKEQKGKSNKKQEGSINKIREILPTKPAVKTSSNEPTTAVTKTHAKREKSETALTAMGGDNTGSLKLTTKSLFNTSSKYRTVIGESNLKRQVSMDQLKAFEEIQKKSCKLKDSTEDNKSLLKPTTNWTPLTKNRNTTIDGSEDTFFGASTRVCNSTALPNAKSACQRQIDRDSDHLNAHKTATNKKRAASQLPQVLKKTTTSLVYGEENDKDTTQSYKNISNINENYTPVKVRSTQLSKKPSTDINSDTETFNHKVDTPRPKNRATSTKLIILSPNTEIMDNKEFAFKKPRGRPKNILNPKCDTKTGTDGTDFVGSQVTALVTKEKKQQEEIILPVEVRDKEKETDQENNCDSKDFYNGCGKNFPSIPKVKKLNTNTSIKSNLRTDKSIESGDSWKKFKIKRPMSAEDAENDEGVIFLKQPNVLVSEIPYRASLEHSLVLNSSTRIRHKDDSRKKINDYISLNDSADANDTGSSLRMERNSRESKRKNKNTKVTTSRKTKSNNSNVSSTTIHSPDVSKHLLRMKKTCKRIIIDDLSNSDDEEENDCTIVSSTTNIEPPHRPPTDVHTDAETSTSSNTHNKTSSSTSKSQQQEASYLASSTRNHSSYHHSHKDILIYTPKNPSLAPAQSFSNDGCFFHITKEHLSNVIGERPAEKFLKYYIGRRRFNKNSTIYFKPPSARVLDTNTASSSDSDVDDLESMGQYGDIYESVEGAAGGSNNAQDDAAKHS